MKILSKKSIIFYSILGAFTAFFIAPFIRNLLDLSLTFEILITSAIVIPMYIVAKRLLSKYL